MSEPRLTPPIVWSPEARSWASLLIFVHLFIVVVAVTTYTRPSLLQQQLHDLFAPYLHSLHLTASPTTYPYARFFFTHGGAEDVDFSWRVEVEGSDGKSTTTTVPAPGLWPGVRQRRYQALANAAGYLTGQEASEDTSGVLPRDIGGAVLRQLGGTEATIKGRAHQLPLMEELDQVEARRQAALQNFRDVYEAQVFISGDTVNLIRKSATLEVAPVDAKSKAKGKQP